MGKKILMIVVAGLLILTMTACGDKKQSVADNKGNMLVYEKYEVSENGFYVRDKKNDTFTPVMTQFEKGGSGMPSGSYGFSGVESSKSGDVPHLWLGQANYDPSKLIPTVDEKRTELVMWYDGSSDMPEEFTLAKCKRLGYTLGIHFTFGDTANQLFITGDNICSTSDAKKLTSNMSDGLNRVNRINNRKKLPLSNIDTDVNMLLGLEKNKTYQVGYFDGTKYQSEEVIADTLAFKILDVQDLESPFRVTEEDYFVINLPDNLQKGYYYINDIGLFKYEKRN